MNKKPYIAQLIQIPGKAFLRAGLLLVVCLLCLLQALTGSDNYPAGARSMALSHASVSFSDTWATFHNQAGIAGIKKINTGFFFESKFGIEELSLAAGSVILPAGNGAFGISLLQFGKGAFHENKYALAYARRLSEKWCAGLQLDYFSCLFPENGRANGFATFEGGLLFRVTTNLNLGAHAFNPVSGGYDYPSGRQELPRIVRAGGHYSFDDAVLIAFEAQKDNMHPVVIKTGIEFLPAECMAVRIGVSGSPVRYTAGFGYRSGKLSADMGFGYHGNLGITPSLSLQLDL